MDHARASGVIVCCAAGQHVRSVCAPAVLPTAVAVAGITPGAATDGSADKPWKHSCMGPEVAFSGPAAQMRRPLVVRQGIGTEYRGDGDGTSYAAAITTGSAALWLRRWSRQIDAKYGRTAKRLEAFKAAVQATSTKPNTWQPQPFGAGVIHVGRLCTNQQQALPAV